MIIFVTVEKHKYFIDPATVSNGLVISSLKLSKRNYKIFLKDNAKRENLINAVKSDNDSIFIMSHGGENTVWEHSKNNKPALDVNDIEFIKGRIIFIFACKTAKNLGIKLSKHNLYLGYTGAIQAPPSTGECLKIVSNIFKFIIENLDRIGTKKNREQFINSLYLLCMKSDQKIDKLTIDNKTKKGIKLKQFGEAKLCILHIWDRLRIIKNEKVSRFKK